MNHWIKTKFQRELMDYFGGRMYKSLDELVKDLREISKSLGSNTQKIIPLIQYKDDGERDAPYRVTLRRGSL